jgi:hypothetical protein
VDLWDWLAGLLGWLFDLNWWGLRFWLLVLLATLVIWWLWVPYFNV